MIRFILEAILIIVACFAVAITFYSVKRFKKRAEVYDSASFVFESIQLVLTLWDSDYEIIDCNQEAVRRFGLSSKEEYKERINDLIPKTQPDGYMPLERCFKLLFNVHGDENLVLNVMHYNLDGEEIPMEVSFFKDTYKGKPVILTCATDMRSVYESMEREHEITEHLQLMFNATPMVIMYWNKEHQCIDCNQAAASFFNLVSKAELTHEFHEYETEFQPDDTPSDQYWKEYLDKTFEEGYTRFEYAIRKGRRKDDEIVFLEVIGQRMKYKNEVAVVTFANDISAHTAMLTEKERSEIFEANSQAKSRFLARMSHEIRTPITAVIGISEILLQNSDINKETEEAITKIYNSSSSLIRIINDILDLSKIEAGKMSLIYDNYEPTGLISDVIQMNTVLLGSKPVNFVVKVDENIPTRLHGDELRIRQVLNNVLSNAFKYTENGSVEFTVECRDNPNKEKFVNLIITVKDTGKGMTAEQLDTLFKEFTRFHEFGDRFTEGTGLGMPIVHSLLHLMSAHIDVDSNAGEGTTVILVIPQQSMDDEVIGAEASKRLEQFETGKRSKKITFVLEPMPHGSVLVVDDVETNRFVARGLLGFYQLNIETCNSGAEAIELIESGKTYDIVFMDYMMPGLNGIETTRALREMGYDKPILALTANVMIGKAEEFSSQGFNGFVAKPINSADLDAVLKKFIKKPDTLDPQIYLEADDGDIDDYYNRPEVKAMMRMDFVENQSDAIIKIREALDSNDYEAAEIIAHTVASLSRYMKEDALTKAASIAEESIIAKNITPEILQTLEDEINHVLK
ncbi:MAG: ATP-binding protein [Defluviitaleaceae bacterium]|nr:ATP-binding protein [Defluviitaleaceae bacterium]